MEFFKEHFGILNVQCHDDYGIIVQFDSFCDKLKNGSKPTDLTKFRKDSLVRTLRKRNELIHIPGEPDKVLWLKLRGLLSYAFQHCEDIAVCAHITNFVEATLSKNLQLGIPSSILELYELVARRPLRNINLESFYSAQYNLDEQCLPTLYTCHKEDIRDEVKWNRIKFFEYHFAKRCGSDPQENVDEVLRTKYNFYQLLMQSADLGKEISQINEKVIACRTERKKIAKSNSAIQYKATQVHKYSVLDNNLLVEVTKSFPGIDHLHVIPSKKTDRVSICLSGQDDFVGDICGVASIIYGYLDRKHGLDCQNIHILSTEVLSIYSKQEVEGFARFSLADAISQAKTTPIHTHRNDTLEDVDKGHHEEKCPTCFPSSELPPLEISTFNLFNEWLTDVPLVV